jgi:hypothetical protein
MTNTARAELAPIVIERRFDTESRSAGYRYWVVAPDGRKSPESHYFTSARAIAEAWAATGQRIAFGWKRGGGGPLDPLSAEVNDDAPADDFPIAPVLLSRDII